MLWVIGGATVLLAAVISFAVTRRYGPGLALILPVLALAAMLGMNWQARAPGQEIDLVASLALASPILLGVLAGIGVARLYRG